eukprot:TRINITY_DN6282_c0_g1_i1.p1 TRINITY_DN6282_c0_g1~~TRINITY_DN6282_c0_g1_i1.p1  ORF type:complete len:578 (+),score=82.24 TRINITY_DN6282_c0_g1_i1:68-1735(+)
MSCPICLEKFTDDRGIRLPKALPCLHTICEICLSGLADMSGRIACPTCRADANIKDVKTNFALAEAMGGGHRSPPAPAVAASAPAVGGLQGPLLASAPGQEVMAEPQIQPWQVRAQNVYQDDTDNPANIMAMQALQFAAPAHPHASTEDDRAWIEERRKTLFEWGRKREAKMRRWPTCFMDQMVSGSNFYPLRLLADSWFTDAEQAMIRSLQELLHETGHSHALARDMLAPLVYDIDVRIVLDNSGSMNLPMLGTGGTWNEQAALDQAIGDAVQPGWFSFNAPRLLTAADFRSLGCPRPSNTRWYFARDALRKWMHVYNTIGLDPPVYLLNPTGQVRQRCTKMELEAVFDYGPSGSTAMTETIDAALYDHKSECPNKPLFLLILTDGEANNMVTFNNRLVEIQNEVHGDVQVCLLGLSLVKQDIEWFENEECDYTRIRTVEPFEVEQQRIRLREVVKKEGAYNFAMHTFRSLLTNIYPADYDYEAHLQNFRHRAYITCHNCDAFMSLQIPCWSCCSIPVCVGCYVCTGAHCAGWCQGNDCGKCQQPEGWCCGEEG